MIINKTSKFFIIVTIALLGIIVSISTLTAQTTAPQINLIPYPQSVIKGTGIFTINSKTKIALPAGKKFLPEAELLNVLITNGSGKSLAYAPASANVIQFITDNTITADEGYKLTVTTQKITLAAKTASGIFRGVETLRQLLPDGVEQTGKAITLTVPAVIITDQPAYAWRGMHLDVSRHFFSVEYLKKYIDRLALYKFNKLHLHLTDDQGWRIEIKKYPKLTEFGAWRTFNNQDSACIEKSKDNPDFAIDPKHIIKRNGKTLYGGFYTQAQMKDVIAYAMKRHIDIIPEIDMPGHMMAAINNYPFLSCTGGSKWGELFTTPICPCNESTYEFAENVYKEIFALFPSKYIHIGGDEVDRTSWGESEACKAMMAKVGLKTSAELQSYFINRMEKFFNRNGKKLIGWDEILEDGISSTAVVMYWRSWVPNAPIKAAKNGNKVIMTPGNPLYFDNDPDQNSVYNVYHFNPIPEKLNKQEAANVIGAQANLWSERIPTENRADYMIFPRMTALAEVLWTNKKNYKSYQQRLLKQYPRFDALKIHYRLPDFTELVESNVFTDEATLNVSKPLPGLKIFYTSDGLLPTQQSTELTGPLKISQSQNIRLVAYTASGVRGDLYNLKYVKQPLAEPVNKTGLQAGLVVRYFPAFYKKTTLIPDTAKNQALTVSTVTVPKEATAPSFGLKYRGYLDIPTDGVYTFYLTCDDGGILKVADRLVVDNEAMHSAIEKSGQVALKKGLQPFEINFLEGGGGYALKLLYSKDGSTPAEIPASWLKH
ncbi:family 20 glycosylhydrolase [Mucilaginibacter defluvii]|uniref:beta-N-acetylhexosaminidase n=1 Tax=Mucilaginibacter defluvii TaxID=1196019 RepID=A0ABP9G102_9SPHI